MDLAQEGEEKGLTISWLDCAVSTIAFILVLLFFWGMSAAVGWPNQAGGWETAVIVAAAVAAMPFAGRTLDFLKRNKASMATPLGFKFDFTQAIQASESSTRVSVTVQQAQSVGESGRGELEDAAAEASLHQALVLDLEGGQAWYLTRIFALAAMARPLGAPQYLIFIGQIGGNAKQALGYIKSETLVRALVRNDPRYRKILSLAESYLAILRDPQWKADGPAPPGFPHYHAYKYVFGEVGDAIFMRILVDQLINPDPGLLEPGEQAPETGPPWVDAAELDRCLSAWLVKDRVDLDTPVQRQVSKILEANGSIVLAVRNGTYEGIIQIDLFIRHLLGQLSERKSG